MILFVCASIGENLKLTQELSAIATGLGIENDVVSLMDLKLPLYSTLEEEENGVPSEAMYLGEKLLNADSFFMISPEYNGGMAPVLNNAIAWVSRASGDDWRKVFNQKFSAIGTHSGGPGTKCLGVMDTMLTHLGCNVLARRVSVTYGKALKKETGEAVLNELNKLSQLK